MKYTSVLAGFLVTLTSLFFNGLKAVTGVHNSVFFVCNILLNLYVVHVLYCICKIYLLTMSGSNVRLVNV